MSATTVNSAPTVLAMRVNGDPVAARSGRTFNSANPATGEVWAQVPDGSDVDVDDAVRAARGALDGTWGDFTAFERSRVMRRAADLIMRDIDTLAELEAQDSGRLVRDAKVQVAYVAEWLQYFAGLADTFTGQTIPTDDRDMLVYTESTPVGVVGAIIPWNAPLLLLAWKLAPALATGCTMVVKPSDYTPATAIALGDLLTEAGLPVGTYNVVTGFGPDVGVAMTAHPGIDKIAFTGSTATGIAVGRAALNNMTRLTLELGGKSAQIVFDDADFDAAIGGVMNGIFIGTGQTCIAGSRLIVHESLHDAFVERLVERAGQIRIGSPTDESTQMGPVVNEAQHRSILEKIEQAVGEGATLECGGGVPEGMDGLYVEPTILTNVRPEMTIAREEVFGPILAVIPFRTEEEAVALANDSEFGLSAGVWSRSIHRAHRVARQMRAGTVWVNTYRKYSPAAPFGGFGMSGIGRENGHEAMRAYTETRTVWVETSGAIRDPFSVR